MAAGARISAIHLVVPVGVPRNAKIPLMGVADKFIIAEGASATFLFPGTQGVSLMQNCRVNGIFPFLFFRLEAGPVVISRLKRS